MRHLIGVALLCAAATSFADGLRAADQPLLVIAGASGQTGRVIIAQAAERYTVRALSGDLARAKRDLGDTLFSRARWVEVDVRDSKAISEALRGAEYVISVIGAREWQGPRSPEFIDYRGNVNLIDAAREAGARHFTLISSASAGSHKNQSQNPRLGGVLLWKTRAEAHLQASGLGYTILGPAGLLNTPGGRNGIAVIPRAEYVSTNVSRADVARVAIDSLTNADARDKSFALVGDQPGDPEGWRAQLRALSVDTAAPASTGTMELDSLQWLTGHWRSRSLKPGEERFSEEWWSAPLGGLMLGMNREIIAPLEGTAGARTSFEYMRIERSVDDGLVYRAQPAGGLPTEFTLQALESSRVVFANPQHDFPQTIMYWLDGAQLRARVEGTRDGKDIRVEYAWERAAPDAPVR